MRVPPMRSVAASLVHFGIDFLVRGRSFSQFPFFRFMLDNVQVDVWSLVLSGLLAVEVRASLPIIIMGLALIMFLPSLRWEAAGVRARTKRSFHQTLVLRRFCSPWLSCTCRIALALIP